MKYLHFVLMLCIALTGCSEDDENQQKVIIGDCDLPTIIDQNQFQNAPGDFISINELEIDGDCLKINFSASGCNGESFEVELIDSGAIAESNPPQRTLRLSVVSDELCQAIIGEEMTFNISQLRVDGGAVLLNFTDSSQNILYEY